MKAHLGNPWKGVVPYTIDDPHPFKGRNEDIENLFEIVETNDISTLYGRSGIGKTSLLNAGLFPCLREHGYRPVSIRLGVECGETESFAQCIVSKLQEISQSQNDEVWSLPSGSESDLEYLWCYFAYHRFFVEDQEVIPVIILDQFEEILRNSKEKASLLIRQLSATLHDGTLTDGTDYTIGFRFIISIREDDLYLLEDCLDDSQIEVLKRGRYRLRPIDIEKAKEEIIFADRKYFDATSDEQDEIARLITDCATQEKQLSTLLLSLLCSMVYEKCKPNKITLEKVKQTVDADPLSIFYRDAIKGIPEEVVQWIENNLIDGDRRRCVPLIGIPSEYGSYIEQLYSENNSHRLFTTSSSKTGNVEIELLHDKLVDAINETKEVQLRLMLKKRYRRWSILSLFLLLFCGLFWICWHISNVKNTTPVTLVTPTDTIRLIPQQYEAKNGKLILTDGTYIEADALSDIDNVKYLEVGDCKCEVDRSSGFSYFYYSDVGPMMYAYLGDNNLFPDCDTVVISTSSCSILDILKMAPNLSVLKLTRDDYADFRRTVESGHRHVPNLRLVEIFDTSSLRWHMGTLFAKYENENCWYPLASNRETVVYSDSIFSSSCVKHSTLKKEIVYDISNPPVIDSTNADIDIILTCTDYREINNRDIPEIIRQNIIQIDFPHTKQMNAVFTGCEKLRRINMPNVDYIVCDCFSNCYSLEDVNIPRVKIIHAGAFCNTGLSSINCPKVEEIERLAFANCGFDSIFLPNARKIDECAFLSCKKLKYADISTLSEIEVNVFAGCLVLQNIFLPNVETIHPDAFENCALLQTINLPNVSLLSKFAFRHCASLQNIYAPNIQLLDQKAFEGCIQLKKVILPKLDTLLLAENEEYSIHTKIIAPKKCKVLTLGDKEDTYSTPNKLPSNIKLSRINEDIFPFNTTPPKEQYKGYYVRGNLLVITDTLISNLYIPANVHYIDGYIPGTTEIEHISMPFFQKSFFDFSSGIALHPLFTDACIIENRKRIKVCPNITTPPSCTQVLCTRWEKAKDYHEALKTMTISKPVTLFVPYGKSRLFHRCLDIKNIRNIQELGPLETLFYRYLQISKFDIMDSIPCILFMLIALFALRFKQQRRKLLLDIIIGLFLWILIVVILLVKWRTLYAGFITVILYFLYLILTKRKREHPNLTRI